MRRRLSVLCASLAATGALLACDGEVVLGGAPDGGSAQFGDGSAPGFDAASSKNDAAVMDASAPLDASLTCETINAELHELISADAGPPPNVGYGIYEFLRQNDFLGFFRYMAENVMLVVPAHQVDCSSMALLDGGACTYDPREPRIDASDIFFSNQLNQFTAPTAPSLSSGGPWVWAYELSRNTWFAASQQMAPNAYAVILEYNSCLLAHDP